MAIPGTIKGKIVDAADYVGKFISTNGHAQQAIPAMHRLSAAGGMYLGWKGGDQMRDAVFANNQISEGEFVEKKKEEIPGPLRFMYHAIDWNPHSDAPSEQWKKILYQSMPAIGAALGTVAGSSAIFHFNGRAAKYAEFKKPNTTLSVMDAEYATGYAQGGIHVFGTSLLGGASATSGLVVPYGMELNTGFYTRNGNAVNLFNRSGGNLAPPKALEERLAKVPFYIQSAIKSGGKISKDWASIFVRNTLKHQFPKDLDTTAKEAKAIDTVHGFLQEIYDKHSKTLNGEELIKKVRKEAETKFGIIKPTYDEKGQIVYHGYDKLIKEDLSLKFEDLVLGNSSRFARAIKEGVSKVTGIGRSTTAEAWQQRIIDQNNSVGTAGRGGIR